MLFKLGGYPEIMARTPECDFSDAVHHFSDDRSDSYQMTYANDTIYGGLGDDNLYGDGGVDKIFCGPVDPTARETDLLGHDIIDGGSGADKVLDGFQKRKKGGRKGAIRGCHLYFSRRMTSPIWMPSACGWHFTKS